ncbi:MAG: hypothetical protein LBQ62_04530 [Candidatus Accumulibacter sp.]|jgi:hypothetical protein|nr:hypothetical protein [Accumulibacter sp.]
MTGVPTDFLGWALLLVVLPGLRWRLMNAAAQACLLLLLLVPLIVGGAALQAGPLSILRGLFGGLSVSTVTLLAALTLQNMGNTVFAGREAKWLPPSIAAVALPFYPTALGWGALDPYEWGHDEALALPLAVGALALAAWLAGWRASALAFVLALAGWRLRLLESTNLWDYLLDPLLAFTALGMLAARGLRRVRRQGRAARGDSRS